MTQHGKKNCLFFSVTPQSLFSDLSGESEADDGRTDIQNFEMRHAAAALLVCCRISNFSTDSFVRRDSYMMEFGAVSVEFG